MQKDKNYIIKKYIELGNYHKNDIAIVIVANVDGKTKQYDDYENASVLSEYYTLDEFETISQTIKNLDMKFFVFLVKNHLWILSLIINLLHKNRC